MPSRLSRLIAHSSTVLGASPFWNSAATRLCGASPRAAQPTLAAAARAAAPSRAAAHHPPRRSPANRKSDTSWLASNPPTAKPIGTPADIRITSRPWAIGGAKSEASAIASGMPPPRPNPVRNRRPANCDGEPARAESREKTPNTATQPISTGLRPSRSPSNPAQSEPSSSPTLPAVSAWVNTDGRNLPSIDERRDCIANGRDVVAFEKQNQAAQPGHAETQSIDPIIRDRNRRLFRHVPSIVQDRSAGRGCPAPGGEDISSQVPSALVADR